MLTPFGELVNQKSKLPVELRLSAWFFVLLALWTVVATVMLFGSGTAVFPSLVTAVLGFPGLSTASASSGVNIYLLMLIILVVGFSLFITLELLRRSRRGLVYALIFDGVLLVQVVALALQKVYPRTIFDYATLIAEVAVMIYLIGHENQFKHQ